MRSDVIRTYKTLHTWTGLIGGMLLFICFYAGALTMFKEVLNRWASPTHEQPGWVEQQQLPALVEAVLAKYPEAANAFTLHLLPVENAPAPMTWQASPGHPELMRGTLDADGELLVSSQRPSALGELVDLLHRTAGIPGEGHHYIGVYVMGFICILYMLALVSGLIVLLPTLVSDFFALRRGKNLKRFWLDAHNVVGITSLPFHILIAWSVIVFAFHDQIYDGLQKYVYGEREMFISGAAPPPPAVRPLDDLMSPAEILEQIRKISPGFVPREMNYRQLTTLRQSVQVMGEDRDHMVRTGNRGFVTLDPFSGEILDDNYLPGYENGWLNIVITFFALHFGSFGGYAMRWVYFLLGLAGSFLFYSGNLLWIESRRRKQRRGEAHVTQKKNTELMAAATVGVCWGCVAGVSAAMVAGKWLYGLGDDPESWYFWTYYVVFVGSVGWAFAAGPARAAVHLLWLCAVTTLAIPLTGVLALILPNSGTGPWLHTSPDLLVVELTASITGVIFIYMARRMTQRINKGSPDSVWSNSGINSNQSTLENKKITTTLTAQ